jgi:hypothetical protein
MRALRGEYVHGCLTGNGGDGDQEVGVTSRPGAQQPVRAVNTKDVVTRSRTVRLRPCRRKRGNRSRNCRCSWSRRTHRRGAGGPSAASGCA